MEENVSSASFCVEIEVGLSMHFKGKLFRTNVIIRRVENVLQLVKWLKSAEKTKVLSSL
jgi:hypothetical protein